MLESHLHKLILLNAGCCLLFLLGKILQELLLGPLREIEAMKVRLLDPPPHPYLRNPGSPGGRAPRVPQCGTRVLVQEGEPLPELCAGNHELVYCLELNPTP
jgi:hypothetical protein